MDQILFLKLVLIALGLTGIFVSYHVLRNKNKERKMVCPLGFKCSPIFQSRYARFLATPVERLGLIYFGFIFLSYALLLFIKEPLSELLLIGLLIYSFSALLFSIYLFFVHSLVLRKGCSWCVFVEISGIVIFILMSRLHSFMSLM